MNEKYLNYINRNNNLMDYKMYKVVGDSMAPYYLDGDVITVKESDTAESGDDVIMLFEDLTGTLRRFIKEDNCYTFKAFNKNDKSYHYDNPDDFHIVGVVVRMTRNYKDD